MYNVLSKTHISERFLQNKMQYTSFSIIYNNDNNQKGEVLQKSEFSNRLHFPIDILSIPMITISHDNLNWLKIK